MRRLTYLAIPYSHPDPAVMEKRFQTANRVAAVLMKRGVLVFSAISHSHPIALDGGLPLGFDFWEEYDRTVLSRCGDMIVVQIDGWERSKGVQAEIAIADELGIPVLFVDEYGETLRGR